MLAFLFALNKLLPSTGIPSFHHETFDGGLLELESQSNVASMPGFSSSGTTVILTVSGATEMKIIDYKMEI